MLALVWLPAVAVQTVSAVPAEAGYVDFVYAPTTSNADDVTANASMNKLWFHDGIWWGAMFSQPSPTDQKFRIFRLNMATQTWTATARNIDDRDRAHLDALQTPAKLYIASAHPTAVEATRVYRFSYNAATDAYALDGTFPRNVSTVAGANYASIVQDSTGRLWVAYGMDNTVMLTSSGDFGATWSAPFALPGIVNTPGVGPAGSVDETDDRVQLVRVGGTAIGVMWSRTAAMGSGFYFATHNDADAEATWGAEEAAWTGTDVGDNHISVKSASDGRVIAAVKSGLGGSSPLIAVLERSTGGTWATPRNVSSGSQNATRPIIVLDEGANQAHVFMTVPVFGGDINVRTAPLGSLAFGAASLGTKVIDSSAHPAINDPTSTSQRTTLALGNVVLATDIPTRTYLHGCLGAACPQRPVADFTATPTSGFSPLTVQFTDTSTGAPTSWLWDFGDGTPTSVLQNPSHSYGPGTYTVTMTATNAAGSDTITKSNLITVTEPPGGQFVPITPIRVLDSRPQFEVGATSAFAHGVPKAFDVTNGTTIPNDAVAVSGNLTVAGQTRRGFVTLGPDVPVSPSVSTINFPVGDDRANGVIVPLNQTDGSLEAVFRGSPAGGSTHLIFDVTGYFVNDTAEDDFFPIDPDRVIDTRPGPRIATGVPKVFDVAGAVPDVPAGATAVTGNLTIVGQSAAGYASIGPAADPNPTTSNINFPLGDTRANNVTVPLSGAGELYFTFKGKPGSSTDFIFDVTGYFLNDSAGAEYFPAVGRILDSRIGVGLSGTFSHNTPRAFDVEGAPGPVPTTATAVTGNLTVAGQSRAGFATIGPDLTIPPEPFFSNLNFPTGDDRANGVTVATAADGTLELNYRGSPPGGSTHYIFDVSGYFK